jgi:phospholipid-binding lipoprotein MlaA
LGVAGDAAMNPISYTGVYFSSSAVSTAVSGGLGALNAADLRADNLENERIASEAALDRYAFFRGAYFSQRRYLVNDGNLPEDDVLNPEEPEGFAPVQPY